VPRLWETMVASRHIPGPPREALKRRSSAQREGWCFMMPLWLEITFGLSATLCLLALAALVILMARAAFWEN